MLQDVEIRQGTLGEDGYERGPAMLCLVPVEDEETEEKEEGEEKTEEEELRLT